jgi:hypothetical protein
MSSIPSFINRNCLDIKGKYEKENLKNVISSVITGKKA